MGFSIECPGALEVWLKLNIGFYSRKIAAEWGEPLSGPVSTIRRGFDNRLVVQSWQGAPQAFLSTSNRAKIPFFPGFRDLGMKMTKLRKAYLDQHALEQLKTYLQYETMPLGGPGILFKRTTVAQHGSCLTSVDLLIPPSCPRDEPMGVIFNIRASDTFTIFYADMMLLDEILGKLKIKKGATVIFNISFAFFAAWFAGPLMMGLFGTDYLEKRDSVLTEHLIPWFEMKEEDIVWKRRARAISIAKEWLAYFGKSREEGVLWPFLSKRLREEMEDYGI